MNKTQLMALIKEELNNVLNEAPKMKAADAARAKALAPTKQGGKPYDAPIFKKLNALKPKPGYTVDGGPKTAKALETLVKKHGPKYAAGVFEAAIDLTYTGYYASQAYDEKFKNTMQEFEDDVTNLNKIHTKEWGSKDSWVKETKKPMMREAIHSLAAYYTQAGRIGSGEYNLRNALEEIDDILNGLKNAELKRELMSSISDAIDMAYDIGVDEGYEQNS